MLDVGFDARWGCFLKCKASMFVLCLAAQRPTATPGHWLLVARICISIHRSCWHQLIAHVTTWQCSCRPVRLPRRGHHVRGSRPAALHRRARRLQRPRHVLPRLLLLPRRLGRPPLRQAHLRRGVPRRASCCCCCCCCLLLGLWGGSVLHAQAHACMRLKHGSCSVISHIWRGACLP